MGVVYKLKPAVTEFILAARRNNPRLGCRLIRELVEKKFKTPVSKSSVNAVIKSSGLSMPVGRRHKLGRDEVFGRGLGAILLKCADSLLGGVALLSATLKHKHAMSAADITAGLEYLLYSPLFDSSSRAQFESGLWPLIGGGISQKQASGVSQQLEQKDTPALGAWRSIVEHSHPVRSIKVLFSDASSVYLDSQLHTAWPQGKTPQAFSGTLAHVRGLIQGWLQENKPLVFFMAPGYDAPTKEFLKLIENDPAQKYITSFTLCASNTQELEIIKVPQARKFGLFFGLWPWQFQDKRSINLSPKDTSLYFAPLKEGFYVAPVKVKLSQPQEVKSVELKGYALKNGFEEKPRCLILANVSVDNTSLDNFVREYLNFWPNLEETFKDFSHKIQLQDEKKHFLAGPLGQTLGGISSAEQFYSHYVELLNAFVGFYFMPPGYEAKDLATMKKRFYALNASIKRQKTYDLFSFHLPPEFSFRKELAYACQRLNERNIQFQQGQRVWFRFLPATGD